MFKLLLVIMQVKLKVVLWFHPYVVFTKKAINKWSHISETPPNQPDYPWFSKCTLNLGLEKPMPINPADMSHLPPSATGLKVGNV